MGGVTKIFHRFVKLPIPIVSMFRYYRCLSFHSVLQFTIGTKCLGFVRWTRRCNFVVNRGSGWTSSKDAYVFWIAVRCTKSFPSCYFCIYVDHDQRSFLFIKDNDLYFSTYRAFKYHGSFSRYSAYYYKLVLAIRSQQPLTPFQHAATTFVINITDNYSLYSDLIFSRYIFPIATVSEYIFLLTFLSFVRPSHRHDYFPLSTSLLFPIFVFFPVPLSSPDVTFLKRTRSWKQIIIDISFLANLSPIFRPESPSSRWSTFIARTFLQRRSDVRIWNCDLLLLSCSFFKPSRWPTKLSAIVQIGVLQRRDKPCRRRYVAKTHTRATCCKTTEIIRCRRYRLRYVNITGSKVFSRA